MALPSGPYRLHPPVWIGPVLGWLTAGVAVVVGVDYLATPRTGAPVLAVVEAYGSTAAWGGWMLTTAAAVTVALLIGHRTALIGAHLLGLLVSAWYGIALAEGISRAGDGARFAALPAATLVLHVLCLILLGREVRRAAGPPTTRRSAWQTRPR